MFNFWWSVKWSKWWKLIKMWKNDMFFQSGSYVISVRVVNQVKWTITSQFQPHFGGKDGETCKMTKFGHFAQSNPLFWPNLQLWVILSHIGLKQFEKVGKLKKFAIVHTPHPNYTYLYTLDHNFVTIHPIWKNEDINVHNIKIHLFHFLIYPKCLKKFCPPLTYMVGKFS